MELFGCFERLNRLCSRKAGLLFLVFAVLVQCAAAQNFSIPAGSGTLTYSVTSSTSQCLLSGGNPPRMQTITVYTVGSFAYNGQAISGSMTYFQIPSQNSNCPNGGNTGWASGTPIPFPLSTPTGSSYILFSPPSPPTTAGTAQMDALNLSVNSNPAT